MRIVPVFTVEWRCLRCREIPFEHDPVPKELECYWRTIEIAHHSSFVELEKSAAEGCRLCRQFRAGILYREPFVAQGLQDEPCKVLIRQNDSLRIRIGKVEHTWYWEDIATPQSVLPAAHSSPASLLPRFTKERLDQDLELLLKEKIRPWIEDCISGNGTHSKCKQRHQKRDKASPLPTRLIDVGVFPDSLVKLTVPKEDFFWTPRFKAPEYLTLSYCWGGTNEAAKTTRENFEERRKWIDTDSLPKTIQDAIKLTRLMNVQYLWVDAICIIQPDAQDQTLDDWKNEAPKMGSYYSNSLCLISAISSKDSNQGLFIERPILRYPTQSCPLGIDSTTQTPLSLPSPRGSLYRRSAHKGLLDRGWALQEQVLSPRILHWDVHELVWHCPSVHEAPESWAQPWRGRRSYAERLEMDEWPVNTYNILDLSRDAAMDAWIDLLEMYQRMNFTYESDRLVAMQGLAQRLSALHKEPYFAGLFQSRLAETLGWTPNSQSDRKKMADVPTWSWASCKAIIFTRLTDSCVRPGDPTLFSPDTDVLDFSEPSKRTLRLEAPLLSLTVQYPSAEQWDGESFEFERYTITLTYDTLALKPVAPHDTKLQLLILGRTGSLVSGWDTFMAIILRSEGRAFERVGKATLDYQLGTSESASESGEVDWKLQEVRRELAVMTTIVELI